MTAIYLDHAAASPLRPEAREAMVPFLNGVSGNPSSVHRWGREARAALDRAREETAALLGVSPGEVIFTRGGTESTNLAILGRAARLAATSGQRSIWVRSALEHSSVREPMEALARRGEIVAQVGVDSRGEVDATELTGALAGGGGLASFQWVNQETGIILPLARIGELCAGAGVPLHVDATQGIGKLPLDLAALPGWGLLTLSGHKFGGPRGTGVLLHRKGVEIAPLLHGGGQEGGLRPGTEDVAGAVGLVRALAIAIGEVKAGGAAMLAKLRARLEGGLRERIPDLIVHGEEAVRAPHILGIGVPGVPRDLLPSALDLEGVGASAGSACRSGSTEVSPVLAALYGEKAAGFAPLRLSLGWSTTEAEVEEALPRIAATVERIRAAGV